MSDDDVTVPLVGLNARLPVEMMCALGTLAAANAGKTPREPGWRLAFRMDKVFRATPLLVTGPSRRSAQTRLENAIETDRMRWDSSPVLHSEYPSLTVSPRTALGWVAQVMDEGAAEDAAMLRGLIATDVLAPDDLRSTPRGTEMRRTPLMFTSGQQKFLRLAEQLRQMTPAETAMARIRRTPDQPLHRSEAIPSLRWEVRANRQYALMATAPATTPYEGEAGLEWLAWRGLRFFPVTDHRTWATRDPRWGHQIMRWPIWTEPRTVEQVATLILSRSAPDRAATGRFSIGRTSYGYGHFGSGTGRLDGALVPADDALVEFDRVVDRWREAETAFDNARWRRDRGILWAKRRGVSEMEMHRRSGWSRTMIRAADDEAWQLKP